MDTGRKDIVMSVELAIQRELAYRNKVEMSLLRPWGDSWEGYLPLQLPSSNPISNQSLSLPRPMLSASVSVTGTKRKSPTKSLLCMPPQQQQATHSHHAIKDNLFCKVCQISCSGPPNWKQHLRGRQHRAKLQEMNLSTRKFEDSGGNSLQQQKQRWCGMCKIWCIDQQAFKLHLSGQKHQDKLLQLTIGGAGKENQRKWCEICAVWCMNEDAFKQHLEGKKHITALHAIRK